MEVLEQAKDRRDGEIRLCLAMIICSADDTSFLEYESSEWRAVLPHSIHRQIYR